MCRGQMQVLHYSIEVIWASVATPRWGGGGGGGGPGANPVSKE